MTKKRNILLGVAIPAALLSATCLSFSQTNTATSAADTMAKANQAMSNPITDYTLFIVENDSYRYNGDITRKDRYQNVTLIEPVIPISIGDSGWNLINRPVVPVISAPVPGLNSTGTGLDWDRKTGMGDIVLFSLLKPPSKGHFQWGVGPTLTMPTATDDDLGAEKWSLGPAAIALYSSPKMTYGLLAQNWWSIAGDDNREDVSLMNIQYFFTYQISKHWGFVTAPTISANWKADSDNKWSIPVSAGLAYSFMAGKVPCRVLVEPQYFVVQPDDYGAEWNIRIALAMVLPKL